MRRVPAWRGRQGPWLEDEHFCIEVLDYEPDKGIGGYLHFRAEPGGYRCVDLDDVVTVNRAQTLKHNRIL